MQIIDNRDFCVFSPKVSSKLYNILLEMLFIVDVHNEFGLICQVNHSGHFVEVEVIAEDGTDETC